MTGPHPSDPPAPRYSVRPFPSYRFMPGKHPHPRRDPRGHSYLQPEPKPPALPPAEWHRSEDYLYGIDLYNFGYWWECHEIFEALWHAVGHRTEQGNFFQALIQIAAGNLKESAGARQSAERLWRSGLARLKRLPRVYYLGVHVAGFEEDVASYLAGSRERPALVHLRGDGRGSPHH